MSARNWPTLMALTLCCASCGLAPNASGPPQRLDLTGLRQRLAPLCPVPLRADVLEAAADTLAARPDTAPVIGALNRLDKEARVCRGETP